MKAVSKTIEKIVCGWCNDICPKSRSAMSTKKVRIVDDVEVVGPVQDEADYWMSCKKPTVFTLNIILMVSLMGRVGASRPRGRGFNPCMWQMTIQASNISASG